MEITIYSKKRIALIALTLSIITITTIVFYNTPRYTLIYSNSGFSSTGELQPSYDPTINSGESITISLTNVQGQYGDQGIDYTWYINGAKISNTADTYIFRGVYPGYYRIIVDASIRIPDGLRPYIDPYNTGIPYYDVVEGIIGITVNPISTPTPTPTPSSTTQPAQVAFAIGTSGDGYVAINGYAPSAPTTYYDQGTTITISAQPVDSNHMFKYWLIQNQNGATSTIETTPYNLPLTESKSALAVFGLKPTPTPTPTFSSAPTPTTPIQPVDHQIITPDLIISIILIALILAVAGYTVITYLKKKSR